MFQHRIDNTSLWRLTQSGTFWTCHKPDDSLSTVSLCLVIFCFGDHLFGVHLFACFHNNPFDMLRVIESVNRLNLPVDYQFCFSIFFSTYIDRCHSARTHSYKPRSLEPYPLSRFPLGRIPVGRIPLGRIPLGRIPISRCPRSRIPFSRTSLILPSIACCRRPLFLNDVSRIHQTFRCVIYIDHLYIYVYLLYRLGYSSNVRALSKRLRVRYKMCLFASDFFK